MVNRKLWICFENPPPNLVSSVGEVFRHKQKKIEVKVVSFHPLVEYVLDTKDPAFGNMPMVTPLFSFEILSGEFIGQVLFMGSSTFFTYFEKVL
jgi:hypothetical protein